MGILSTTIFLFSPSFSRASSSSSASAFLEPRCNCGPAASGPCLEDEDSTGSSSAAAAAAAIVSAPRRRPTTMPLFVADRLPDYFRRTAQQIALAISEGQLSTRACFDRLPAAIRHAEEVVVAAVRARLITDWGDRKAIPDEGATGLGGLLRGNANVVATAVREGVIGLRDWDDEEQFPEQVRAMPRVVGEAILRGLITRSEQWTRLPRAVRLHEDALFPALEAGVLDYDSYSSIPEEMKTKPAVVVKAIERKVIRTREQWDQLPAAVRANEDVLVAAVSALARSQTAFPLTPDEIARLPEHFQVGGSMAYVTYIMTQLLDRRQARRGGARGWG
eukprot:CAMPEP_0178985922 /NCGR_PEP_ID=MMETSP0795-20121207/2419_1 /TAXON_ID=88552 /ORGANISM="Amoebophrya sp., Strain Ameob2" /LENGTH=333 /DNA_ID=CAMNT_0020676929 /DNA_START=365 /DNA_END=1366 /DNA_ORIENTATION=+